MARNVIDCLNGSRFVIYERTPEGSIRTRTLTR